MCIALERRNNIASVYDGVTNELLRHVALVYIYGVVSVFFLVHMKNFSKTNNIQYIMATDWINVGEKEL